MYFKIGSEMPKFRNVIAVTMLFGVIHFSLGWRRPRPPAPEATLRFRSGIPRPVYGPRAKIEPRIVGGRPVRFGEAPYHLRLEEDGEWECGAALVDYRALKFAITAAHCIWAGWANATHISVAVYANDRIKMVGADLDMYKYDEREQWFGVNGTIIHGSYDPTTIQNDIALIFLDHYAFESLGLNTIPLPGFGWDDPNEFRITGHGGMWRMDENRYLQILELTPIVRKVCHDFHEQTNYFEEQHFTVTKDMMCGGHPVPWVRHGTCFGDSGGPAIGFNYTMNDWYLAGILSWSNFAACGIPGAFTVFTKVSNYIPWITRMAENWIEAHGTGNPYTNGTPTDN